MVHVEIFYGGETGEATLGARYQKGVVQIFPSYQFPSKLWTLKEYYFCSIDTWLEGHCQSVCSEHPWIISTPALTAAMGSRSIFYDSDDESAGHCSDIDEGQEEEEEGGGGGDGEEEGGGNEPVAPPEEIAVAVSAPLKGEVRGVTKRTPSGVCMCVLCVC